MNSFSIIKYGSRGIKEYDFEPDQIFEMLPIILNKMIIGIFNGKSSICSSFIRCYFQYVLLFKKLCLEFEKEYRKQLYSLEEQIFDSNMWTEGKMLHDFEDKFGEYVKLGARGIHSGGAALLAILTYKTIIKKMRK